MVCFLFPNNKSLKPTSRNQTNLMYAPKSENILQKRKKGCTVLKLNELTHTEALDQDSVILYFI